MNKWVLFNYELFLDKDDITVITAVEKEDNEEEFQDLELVDSFLLGIRQSLSTEKAVEKQATIDIPRQRCMINNNLVHSYLEFVRNICYTDLMNDALLLSTQATMAPILTKIIAKYPGRHVSDFSSENPLSFKFLVTDSDHVNVEISKKFRVFKLDEDSEITDLKIISSLIRMDLMRDNHGSVSLSITE
jgi:hypothetical protein